MLITALKTLTAIFIPTYKRPGNIERVFTNIYENTKAKTDGQYRVYFVLEGHDLASIQMCQKFEQSYIINEGSGCYADAINTAYRKTIEPYFFMGADDLLFHPDWLRLALVPMSDNFQVVGTNDMGAIPIGGERDATHYLASREYIEKQSGVVDMPNTVLYPYNHNYCDKEFVETAKSRGVYTYEPNSLVEHLHPVWNKGQMDETYQKGLITSDQDKRTYMERQHLWVK